MCMTKAGNSSDGETHWCCETILNRHRGVFCLLPLRPTYSQAPQCSNRKHSWPLMEWAWSFLEALHDQRRRVSGRGARVHLFSLALGEVPCDKYVLYVHRQAEPMLLMTQNIGDIFGGDGFTPFFFFLSLTEMFPPTYVMCISMHFLCLGVKVKVLYLFRLICDGLFQI